jgi:F-type H+-transporting ATPase subunit gamma
MSGQLKEVRERIKSVISTQQITKAMKMVSAAKFRRAQQAIIEIRPYSNRLQEVLKHVLTSLEGEADTVFNRKTELKKPLIILNTSSRGLCGAFNTNILKAAIAEIEDKYKSNEADGSLIFLCVGKKGYDYVKKHYSKCEIIADWVDLAGHMSFELVEEVAEFIFEKFGNEEIDTVEVAYGRFKNAAVQFPEALRYLPVAPLEVDYSKVKHRRRADYVFEPDKVTLLNELVPSILKTQLHRYFLDTNASEHGARMTAMDKATENAEELLKELRIGYNKARQAAITTEISEIVGGAAALEGA